MTTDGLRNETKSVGDIPVCRGCGFMSHLVDGEICAECFSRRDFWMAGGPLRYVCLESDEYHEDPRCPEFPTGESYGMWHDEEACYAELAGDLERCEACEGFGYLGKFYSRSDAHAETEPEVKVRV